MVARRLEQSIEEEACRQAEQLGVINHKVKAAGQRGWPDRCFLIPGGTPLYIEFKRPDIGELSKGQLVIIRRLRHYGYKVEVCYTAESAIFHIKKALRQAKVRAACVPEAGD